MRCAECRQPIEHVPFIRTRDGRCYHVDCLRPIRRAQKEARAAKVQELLSRRAKRGAA